MEQEIKKQVLKKKGFFSKFEADVFKGIALFGMVDKLSGDFD